MRKILIAVTIILAGCQTTNQSLDSASSGTKKSTRQVTQNNKNSNNSIYNRYKNKTNRYTQVQDGAPTKLRTISFKEPVPSKEPLSRYGNISEYSVDGRSYQVMRSSTGYKARGIASWYGTKFHKQRTSSGEPYDMYVMSAAHKTLPLPTYVKVKNLNNGKAAIVKVNDRGPFHSDRIIDLSYAAALKLGVFPKGTAPVEIETLMGPAGQAHYYLQAGAFTTEILAKRLKDKLARITPSPVYIEHYKQHYIVRVGPFGSKNMADSLKHKLALNGVTGSFSVLI
ncbi:septal ring lytic transglycosylase RlpA family protein [Fluoribacter gormanii]|uniref:Endolytic peptidoglycan transglycosylase RlpA n=1 Tax=Fluoribacter gormanii TaxID=464 RepID=A0A377GJ99_9GAMM|nr:septal ring lytic transglycosylase RlpA family protein [Fluoribacter gormanii]KTD01405.1 rare lipoprotein A [Fluoribacter gormanii]MCW8443565.1 septal ring lytic transglycosylase RlpA family protein [Fluoribacter gormanii]MCW8471992.1 septal ring lytic transglycosylase RlpA family protein [Fluoribacter gormanii]SIR47131.1 rare lipoprotein A [Fluoribacter gormanii]STO24887.1 RlpA-like protein precursor [Fluoribacter gormanii]